MPSASPQAPITPAPRRKAASDPLRGRKSTSVPPSPTRRRLLNAALAFIAVVLMIDALVGEKGLNEDPARIEAEARRQLGLVRPGEVMFILKDVQPASTAHPGTPR